MKFVAILIVFLATIGGYTLAGGHLAPVLAALPYEAMTIIGCAVGAYLISNTTHTVKATIKALNSLVKEEAHDKDSYLDLFSALYMIFKLARIKGWLAIEAHIEEPHESDLFKQFPQLYEHHQALIFLCDYLRIISLGNENPHEIEALMDIEMETIEHDKLAPLHSVRTMADGIPALGIVAAVLGVIKTMGAITEPPEILGKMIGGALTGTFLGVWLAYGFVGPIGNAMGAKGETQIMYFKCIKVAIISFLSGSAPQVAVEYARKILPHHIQPEFNELEDKLNELPSPT
jgi:chemotaxis protein MotA